MNEQLRYSRNKRSKLPTSNGEIPADNVQIMASRIKDYQLRLTGVLAAVAFLVIVTGCGKWGWEDVESDREPVLNVFALISLDSETPSFVRVHRTLGLEGWDMEIVKDTTWYGEGPDDYAVNDVYVSRYFVRDATVTISAGIEDYPFYFSQEAYEHSWYEEVNYVDTLGLFSPEPSKTYFLTVSTPDGMNLTGEVTTPPIPHIYVEEISDTVSHKKTYVVRWKSLGNTKVFLRVNSIGRWNCGSDQWVVLENGETSWTSVVKDCGSWWRPDEEEPDSILIELTSMDENYYNYFIKYADEDEFVNLLLGGGNTGLAYGVEGGYGVFGAIATDRIYRVLVP